MIQRNTRAIARETVLVSRPCGLLVDVRSRPAIQKLNMHALLIKLRRPIPVGPNENNAKKHPFLLPGCSAATAKNNQVLVLRTVPPRPGGGKGRPPCLFQNCFVSGADGDITQLLYKSLSSTHSLPALYAYHCICVCSRGRQIVTHTFVFSHRRQQQALSHPRRTPPNTPEKSLPPSSLPKCLTLL